MGVHYDASRRGLVDRWQDGARRRSRRFEPRQTYWAALIAVVHQPGSRAAPVQRHLERSITSSARMCSAIDQPTILRG